MHAVLLTLEDLWYAFVLVGPDDEMKELWDHVLRYAVSPTAAEVHAFVLVLMQDENIKPAITVLQRPLKLDLSTLECDVQPFVLHVTDPI